MSNENFSYRDLIVWKKAIMFAQLTYFAVSKYPAHEKYGLADQTRRAAVSIASNIAEGSGRSSTRDFAHFLSIARGSLYETLTQLELARCLGYIQDFTQIETIAVEISRMLTTLIKKYSPASHTKTES